jgi:hypothetical protein
MGNQPLFVINVDGEGRAVSVVDKLTGGYNSQGQHRKGHGS